MVGYSTPGHNVAELRRYVANAEVAECFLSFFDHLRAGVAVGAYGCPVEEMLARVDEAGLTVILKELARGDAGLPCDMQVVNTEAISREELTQVDRAKLARYVHHAMSRILRGRFARITHSLLNKNARFAALTPWLASLEATDESAAQERAANARAIRACQSELKIIAMTAPRWTCANDASALSPKRAQERLRRAWSCLVGSIRFDYEVLPSVCRQLAFAAIEHRDLSELAAQTIVEQVRAAALC